MATDTMTSPLSVAPHVVPNGDLDIGNGFDHTEALQNEGDSRSSSLSELGDRAGIAGHDDLANGPVDGSDSNDTEAETERLEISPQKVRKQQNVLLTPGNDLYQDHQSPLPLPTLPVVHRESSSQYNVKRLVPTSDISSLEDSGEEALKASSPGPTSLRKRKRPSLEQDSASDQEILPMPSTKVARLFRNTSAGALIEDQSGSESAEEEDQGVVIDTATIHPTESQLKHSPESIMPKLKHPKRKRRGEMTRDQFFDVADNDSVGAEAPAMQRQGAVSSNEEDLENAVAGDAPEADNAVKTEEGIIQKKVALSSLNALEKCFATLRDKLFGERLSQCNEEIAMLESTVPVHPELLAMKEVIDKRRDQKISHEQIWMRLKLETLQRESVANKAQAHSQYMQTVRDVRDRFLEQLNEKFYQLQRERRSVDGDVPDYMYTFNPKRSQQIKRQTAYNTEVSILSGIAKHVGFPAAPDISKARPQEIEDDLRNMGISTQAPQALHNHPPILRAASSFSHQRSRPDEHFLEQNPWANPQHPSHHQPRQQLHRQVSTLSRAATPSFTPAPQRRIVDLTENQGSASTIPDHPSGLSSSIAATPATGEVSRTGPSSQSDLGGGIVDSTPSKVAAVFSDAKSSNSAPFEATAAKSKASQATKYEKSQSPTLARDQSQDLQTPGSLPKPLPFLHTSGSYSANPAQNTTPGHYTVIKAEETARNSPVPRYHTPPMATVGNGQMKRFAT